jgi:hypothetical protein
MILLLGIFLGYILKSKWYDKIYIDKLKGDAHEEN